MSSQVYQTLSPTTEALSAPLPKIETQARRLTAQEKRKRREGSLFDGKRAPLFIPPASPITSEEASSDSDSASGSPISLPAQRPQMLNLDPMTRGSDICTGTYAPLLTAPPFSTSASTFPTLLRSNRTKTRLPRRPSTAPAIITTDLTPKRVTSDTASSLMSPTTPDSPTLRLKALTQAVTARRAKLAKLKRHLGENVPPELVFASPKTVSTPSLSPVTSYLASPPPPRSDSLFSPSYSLSCASASPSPSPPSSTSAASRATTRPPLLPHRWAKPPTQPPFTLPTPRKTRRRSTSVDFGLSSMKQGVIEPGTGGGSFSEDDIDEEVEVVVVTGECTYKRRDARYTYRRVDAQRQLRAL